MSIDISELNAKTKLNDIKSKAQEFVAAYKKATPAKDAATSKHGDLIQKTVDAVEKLDDRGRVRFLYTLGQAFGGLETHEVVREYTVKQIGYNYHKIPILREPGQRERFFIDKRFYDDWTLLISMNWSVRSGIHLPTTNTIVVPISEQFPMGTAETHTFNWSIFEDKSYGSGSETYVDIYESYEVGAKVPIVDVITFDFKSGVKIGRKDYQRTEHRLSKRVGSQTSQTFVIHTVARNILLYGFGVANRLPITPFGVQMGYQLEQKDAGTKLGTYWNGFDSGANEVSLGYQNPNPAEPSATSEMTRLSEEFALTFAKRWASQGWSATGGVR